MGMAGGPVLSASPSLPAAEQTGASGARAPLMSAVKKPSQGMSLETATPSAFSSPPL